MPFIKLNKTRKIFRNPVKTTGGIKNAHKVGTYLNQAGPRVMKKVSSSHGKKKTLKSLNIKDAIKRVSKRKPKLKLFN